MWHWLPTFFFASVLLATHSHATHCRDRRKQPFSVDSIWNTPTGSGAQYVDAQIFANITPKHFFGDDDYFFSVTDKDPLTPWYNQGWWGKPGGDAHCQIKGKLAGYTRFPHDQIVTAFGNNNAAAILQPDNETLIQMQPLYRCKAGSAFLAMTWALKYNTSVFAGGALGAHGGSHLSSIGGTIRLGELNKTTPQFHHAVKLELFAHNYYYKGEPCYHWPATTCDGYHNDPHSRLSYGGDNPHITPGALLSVPPAQYAQLKGKMNTIAGKKLLFALRFYGGYLVDDTATNRGTFCLERGLQQEFQEQYGYPFDQHSGPFYDDCLAMFKALHVVVNNSPSSKGGGGEPSQPPVGPICSD